MGRNKYVVHCKREHFDVYIGRPSKWGNPFKVTPRRAREVAIREYREWLAGDPSLVAQHGPPPTRTAIRQELHGKILGCWCKPLPCHGDVLAQIANEGTEDEHDN